MSPSAEQFKRVWSSFPTGVTIITTRDGDRTHCMTANAVCSVSLNPLLVLVSVAHASQTHRFLSQVGRFGMNFLAQAGAGAAAAYALSGADAAKTAPPAHHLSAQGAVLMDDALASFDCRVTQRVEAGDHTLFIGEVEEIEARDGDPLIYHGGGFKSLRD